MRSREVVKLKTQNAKLLFKNQIGFTNKSLFDSAMAKIGSLYNIAKLHNVYAVLKLIKIFNEINEFTDELYSYTKKTKRMIRKRAGGIPGKATPYQGQTVLEFSNPVHFSLIKALKYYDAAISYLIIAKNCGAFAYQRDFYRFKNRTSKKILKLLSELSRISIKKLPNVSFNNFIDDDEIYKSAANSFGEVDPEVLYHAVGSTVIPPLSLEESAVIKRKLFEKNKKLNTGN